MEYGEINTPDLLKRWQGGDSGALDALLERHLPLVQQLVHQRLGAGLRRKAETCDFVQDAMVQFLRYGPRILLQETRQFHGILARIAENTIRDKNDWFRERRRAVSREKPLPSDTVLYLDPPREGRVTTPSRAAAANAAEKRYRQAVHRLGDMIGELRRNGVKGFLEKYSA